MKSYRQIKYIPHLCVLRVIVVVPFAIASSISETLYNVLNKATEFISNALPVPYTEKWVKWEQLSIKEQKAIQKIARVRDVMLSQVEIIKEDE